MKVPLVIKGLQVLQTNFVYALVLMFKTFITKDTFIKPLRTL